MAVVVSVERFFAAVAVVAAIALPSAQAWAQGQPPSVPGVGAAKAQAATDFDRIQSEIRLSEERMARLRSEVDRMERDRVRIAAELVSGADRSRKLEASLSDSEARMTGLEGDTTRLSKDLFERRAVLAEVLSGLQRLGRQPPPAVMVRPEDALGAVRSAMLMGAILPELREQAGKLATDLEKLTSLRDRLARERDNYRSDLEALAEEKTRLELLVEERRKTKGEQELALETERQRAKDLAQRAKDLKDLIGGSERDLEAGRRAAAAAAAQPAPQAAPGTGGFQPRLQAKPADGGDTGGEAIGERRLAALDPARMQPSRPFIEGRGLMTVPVAGTALKSFGEDDGSGLTLKGVQFSARAGATVTSPADGWVVYAGTFRSYGKLLIINGGGGYHVVLAGMERISVEIGQFVLSGEPVGEMGEKKLAAVPIAQNADIKAGQPVLYVEFRKDGSPIDPAPWWAKNSG